MKYHVKCKKRAGKGRTSAGVGVGLKSLDAAGLAPSMARKRCIDCILPRRQTAGKGLGAGRSAHGPSAAGWAACI